MSDDRTASKNYFRRLAEEMAEADEPRNRQQAFLDRWWESERAFQRELNDEYMVGGFLERHSTTPSFHKSRRDRDWPVR